MKILTIAIDSQNPDSLTIIKAADLLKTDELIVAPTETRYALIGRADSISAMNKLYNVKRKPKSMPMAVFVKSIESISNYAVMNQIAAKLAHNYLPGPLTLVMKSKCNLHPPIIDNGKIGLRYSSCPFIEKLLDKIDFPVTATSANLYQAGESRNISEIVSVFGDKISLYVDVGELDKAVSTVVDTSSDCPIILREGAVLTKEILELFNYGK